MKTRPTHNHTHCRLSLSTPCVDSQQHHRHCRSRSLRHHSLSFRLQSIFPPSTSVDNLPVHCQWIMLVTCHPTCRSSYHHNFHRSLRASRHATHRCVSVATATASVYPRSSQSNMARNSPCTHHRCRNHPLLAPIRCLLHHTWPTSITDSQSWITLDPSNWRSIRCHCPFPSRLIQCDCESTLLFSGMDL
jgi:hypothetical protein